MRLGRDCLAFPATIAGFAGSASLRASGPFSNSLGMSYFAGRRAIQETSAGWQRTCRYRVVRIASKSATTNTATEAPVSALSGKPSGGSFLDILLSGTGVGIQLPQTVSRVATNSDSDSGDQPAAQDGNAQGSLPADGGAETPAQVSANSNAAATLEAADSQNGQVQNTQASAQNNEGLLASANFDAAQWLVKSASAIASTEVVNHHVSGGAQPATAATKASGSTSERRVKSAAAASSGDIAGIPVPVTPASLALEAAMRTQQTSPALLNSALAGVKAADGNNQDAQDTPSSSIEQAAHFAQTLTAELAGETQPAQSDSQSSSTNGNVAAQVAGLQAAVAANASASKTFPSAQALPNTADLPQGLQFKTGGSTLALSQAVNPPASAGASKSGSQSSDSAASNGGQSGGSTQTGVQAAAQQLQPAFRPVETGALQTVAFSAPSTSHDAGPAHGSSSGTAEGKSSAASENLPSEPLNPAGTAGAPGINSARLIQSMNETEMRVGMRSTEFGDISIRTMVTQQQVQAQISVDHSELSNVLSAHIPAIQAKFGNELGLHATVEVSQSGMSFTGDRGQSSPQQQPRSFTQSVSTHGAGAIVENDPLPLRAPPPTLGTGSRLDIEA